MPDVLSKLGLHGNAVPTLQTTPYYTAHFLIFNFVMTYAALSARFVKVSAGIDHNVNPREDLTTYGPKAVEKGKISQSQLDAMKRLQAAHENAVENFPVFMGSVGLATLAGVDAKTVNTAGAVYTVVRVLYALAYYRITSARASYARSLLWWAGNITCLRLFWLAGKAINAGKLV